LIYKLEIPARRDRIQCALNPERSLVARGAAQYDFCIEGALRPFFD
jgi:hypothetical protein